MQKLVSGMSVLTITMSSVLCAEELGTITVESTTLSDVSGEEVKSADLADALTKQLPGISIVRRSGIANDIILRGQKKDNINILVDNTKIYGACPNRMDPPTSHILTNTIDSIEIVDGPYDVENFGTLSGAVKVTTVKPSKGLNGEVGLNLGSFDYRKGAVTVHGGNDAVRFLLSASKETSAQYEDGDGNTFYDQIDNLGLSAPAPVQYKDEYRDIDAYDKRSFLGKLYIDLTENQELRLAYTANRSDDVLYPSSPMDALYDDSNIFNLEYSVKDLGEYSSELDVQYYSSDVEHPMSTFYRNSSGPSSVNEKVSFLTTDTRGLKIKNNFNLTSTAELTVGVDTSLRNWDGHYEGEGTQAPIDGLTNIPDVDTENVALFTEVEKKYTSTTVKAGLRYDDTTIDPASSSGLRSNDYENVSANVFASYKASGSARYFGGIGRASRVPDARELYFHGAMINMGMVMNPLIGTPTLNETTNTQIDLGVENTYDSFNITTKLFYSQLDDYIYYNADKAAAPGMVKNAFENIDASIYGIGIDGSYFVSDTVYLDFGLAYQRGQKDEALAGQTDKDLAEIPPTKVNVALNYDYGSRNTASVGLVAADKWKHFDGDNGEQAISGYGVVNIKVKHDVTKAFELIAGIDNVMDKTYAVTNTYKDMTLLADGTGDVMLINEPGRYLYVNGTYKF